MTFRITGHLASRQTPQEATEAAARVKTAQAKREAICRACEWLQTGEWTRCTHPGCKTCPRLRVEPWRQARKCPSGRWASL